MMVAKDRYLSVARLGYAGCSKIRYAGFSFFRWYCFVLRSSARRMVCLRKRIGRK